MKLLKEIDKSAVLHIPISQYAFPISEYQMVIRIRTKKDNLKECRLFYGDRVCRTTPVVFRDIVMNKCAKDEEFDYYEAVIEELSGRVCYYFKLQTENEWTYYYADRFSKELPKIIINGTMVDCRSEYYQYPFIMREEIPDVPKWFKEAVVYNIFPDSFANGKRSLVITKQEKKLQDGKIVRSRLGGTIRGIIENLDYIQDLGFTCIYLNPIFIAGEYHKYDTIDYYHIDPGMGTEEEFRELVNELHKRGMKILIDGVFNHCSWQFWAFEDVVEKGRASKYCDWFYQLKFPVVRPETEEEIPSYTCFAYERKMPKLNTSNEEVQEYFAEIGAYWIREYHVDGWRLDVGNEIDRNFWRKFRAAVVNANPEAVLIGEVWENAETWLRGDAFHSTMNYEFRRICREYLTTKFADAEKTAYQFEKMYMRYPLNIVKGQLNLLDTHDVPRFLSICGENVARWKMGCVLLFMMPGVPSLFYGDEKGIAGVAEDEYRRAMCWDKNKGFGEFIKKLIMIRKTYFDSNTDYQPEWQMIQEGLYAFTRKGERGNVTVVLNADSQEKEICCNGKEVLLASQEVRGKLGANGYLILLEK